MLPPDTPQRTIERKAEVKLLSGDKKLAGVIRDIEIFAGLVEAEYLDPN